MQFIVILKQIDIFVYLLLNKSWKYLSTKEKLYGHLNLISQTIQVRLIRHDENRNIIKTLYVPFLDGFLQMDKPMFTN